MVLWKPYANARTELGSGCQNLSHVQAYIFLFDDSLAHSFLLTAILMFSASKVCLESVKGRQSDVDTDVIIQRLKPTS